MANAMTQVNVRISSALKQTGDEAFAAAGLSPSEVVRAVYARASALSHSLRSISDIVTSDALDDGDSDRMRRIELFDQSLHALQDRAQSYGLHLDPSSFEPMTEDEIEEAFYQDYLAGDAS